MPLEMRAHNHGYTLHNGRFQVAGISLQDTGPTLSWSWGVSVALASGCGDTPALAAEQATAAWRAWLARVRLIEASGPHEGSPPLRAAFARDEGIVMVHPDDHHVVYSGGLVVGVLLQDPRRKMDPRIIRPPASPWSWLLHRDYAAGARHFGGSATKADAIAAIAACWNRWLDFAALAPA